MGTFVLWNESLTYKILAVSWCIAAIEMLIMNGSACSAGLYYWKRKNTLNLRTTIITVECNKFPCIRTVNLLNTRRNYWTEAFCSFKEVFDWYGSQKKSDIFVLSYCKNKSSFHNCLWGPFKPSQIIFGVEGLFGRQTSRCETTGLTWSNLDQISSRYVL